MHLHCLTEHLAEGLAVVGRVVPTRATLPVLGNVLLEAADGELRLAATNLTTTVSHRVAATTGVPGRTTLPARLLADYVGLLDRGQAASLALDPGTHKVHLACGRYEANIAAIDADDFPPLPDVGSAHAVTLPTRTLKEAIRQVAFAAAPDDSRPVLAGILVRSSGSRLTLAAADGFRLAVRTLDLPAVAPDLSLIVPASAMAEVARLLPAGPATRGPLGRVW
jgi:DNA polymerase-3 subunit beta